MNAETALRKIPIRIEASVRLDGIDIRADDGHGHQSEVTLLEPLPEARTSGRQRTGSASAGQTRLF
ncbi:MAG: hypothetical protein ACLTHV_00365 [Parasutterella excrementihominis]